MLAAPALARAEEGWVPLFDGRSLAGWKASENAGSWKAEGGRLVFNGGRSHLFYSGPVRQAAFKNFELQADVLTEPLANSGVFFHTAYQEKGFPADGFEVQVANTALGEGTYRERKKTGSLYGVRDVYKQFVKDGEWFQMHIVVRGKRVRVYLNGMMTVDYVEPDPPVKADQRGRYIHHGTFALQGHDPGSKVSFRNILVKPLPDDISEPAALPLVDQNYLDILQLHAQNYPVVDYHVHLKGGLTIAEAVAESHRLGIGYGVAINCGQGFPTTTDAGAEEFLRSLQGQPVFIAMQAEGREWVKMFSRPAIAKFDYVFTDAMTFTDGRGKRMRLWIKEEVGQIPDARQFMDTYVDRIVGVMRDEPIDIYANPTFLPDVIARQYDELWTTERMSRVIEAAVKHSVAIELNNRYRIPSAAFVKLAKQAGAKFSFGTNNSGRELGRIEYSIEMVKQCSLKWPDIFVPRPEGEKRAQRSS
jgi:hypothetical protein